jgi:hypothetical protein
MRQGLVVSGRGYIIGVCLVPAYEIGRRLQTPYFTEHLFSVLGHFGSIFALIGQFRPFFGAHFPSLPTFTVSPHGILARRIAPCTIAHPKQRLKQDVRPQPLSKK